MATAIQSRSGMTAEGLVAKWWPGFGDLFAKHNYEDQVGEFVLDAESQVERELRLFLDERLVVTAPGPNEEYDVEDEGYDFNYDEFISWGYIHLNFGPVTELLKVELRSPFDDTLVMDYDVSEHVRARKYSQSISAVPHTLYNYAQLGIWLPIVSAYWRRDVPRFIHVDYKAGFKRPEDIPREVLTLVELSVAARLAPIIDNLVRMEAGGYETFSMSVDGLSQSLTPVKIMDKAKMWAEEREKRRLALVRYMRPVLMEFI